MGPAFGVGEGVAKDHVAAAFAIDVSGFSGVAQALEEGLGGGEAGGVEFGIAAGEEDQVGGGNGVVGEGGEGRERRAGGLPVVQEVGIGEGKAGSRAMAMRWAGA